MPEQNTEPGTIRDLFRDRMLVAKMLGRTALVAGVFCLVLWFGLLAQHFIFKTDDALKSQRLNELKEQLRAGPKNESIKQQIREFDLHLRQRYFQHLKLSDTGGWLLLASGILFFSLAKKSSDLRKKYYLPQNRADSSEAVRMATFARTSVAALALVIVSALLTLAFSVETKLPANRSGLEKLLDAKSASKEQRVSDIPSREEFNKNWPQFRGPTGSGISFDSNPTTNFDAGNLIWKTEVPAPGFNSPIVWGKRIFLSGGDATKREVFCFSAETGETVWRQAVQLPKSKADEISIPESTGYAASTMATDGRRVYVMFANDDLAAFTFDGQLLWSKNLGKSENQYGHAASLATWQDRVIVQLDQGHEDDHLSKLYAFDGKTGQVIWERPRPVDESWASPIVIEAAGKNQIITLSVPWIISYAATDGTELWRADGFSGEVTSSPAFGGGLIFAVSPNDNLFAIRPDGQGDVTKTHIAWKSGDNAPDISSPVANDKFIFTVSTSGLLTCQEIGAGRKVWEHEFKTEFFASPVIAGGRVYIFSTKGTAITAEAGGEFREISHAELNEGISASPAFAQNRIFIRGHKHLFCFGTDAKKLAKK